MLNNLPFSPTVTDLKCSTANLTDLREEISLEYEDFFSLFLSFSPLWNSSTLKLHNIIWDSIRLPTEALCSNKEDPP